MLIDLETFSGVISMSMSGFRKFLLSNLGMFSVFSFVNTDLKYLFRIIAFS